MLGEKIVCATISPQFPHTCRMNTLEESIALWVTGKTLVISGCFVVVVVLYALVNSGLCLYCFLYNLSFKEVILW